MKTFDHGFENGKGKIKRKKGSNSNLKKVQRYVASLNKEQISRMVSDSGKPHLAKGKDVTGENIYKKTKNSFIQPKLEISQPNDRSEQQADKVAAGVMKGDTGLSKTAMEQPVADISTKGENSGMSTTPEFDQQLAGTKGQGQKLDKNVQSEMESHLGSDLSGVNIHTGGNAKTMNQDINAKAFTHGQDVYFNQGQYNPASDAGKSLLAHELTHTVQQGNGLGRKAQISPKKKKAPSKKQTPQVKPYIIERDVSTTIAAVGIFDMQKNLKLVFSKTFATAKQDQEINATQSVGKDVTGIYQIAFYHDAKEKPIISHRLHLEKGKEFIVKTVGELTRLRVLYKNYDAVKAKMDEWEIKEPGLKGKMSLYKIQSGDNFEKIAKNTVGDNNTNFGNLSKKLQELNTGINAGVVGNGVIVLKNWKDPNIGTVPKKPDAKKLTEDQKVLIATIYGEVSSGANAAEQQKYIWYSMVLRVKSPNYDADLYNVVKSGAYQAYNGNSQYTKAKKQLDENKPDGNVTNIINTILSVWNTSPPADAGIQYSHYNSDVSDKVKISDYYTGSKTQIDETAENEAVYKFLVTKKWDKQGLSKTKAWKKRIRMTANTLQYTMYVFN